MKCVACQRKQLAPVCLDDGLKALQCRACGGQWLSSQHYWQWLQQHTCLPVEQAASQFERSESTSPTPSSNSHHQKAVDRKKAGLCPTCESILLRFQISPQLDFKIEQCGCCNGIWLDRHKWEQIKTLGLHRSLHRVASVSWQANLRRHRRQAMLELLYEQKFKENYSQLKQIEQWLKAQPPRERASMLDYLVHHTSRKSV